MGGGWFMRGSFVPAQEPVVRRNLVVAAVVVGMVFVVLLGRLWYLQLIKGSYFRRLSENNRLRLVDIPPSRGLIFDRKGRLLADNRPAFALAIVPEDVKDWDQLARRLKTLVGISAQELARVRALARTRPGFKPIRLRSMLDRHQLAVLETFRYELVGVKVIVEYRRAYLAPTATAHVIGYLGEISRKELRSAPRGMYRMGDYVGRYGVERSWERVLHGKRGVRQVEVDAMGRELKELKRIPPVPGYGLVLSIDLRLQEAAERALKGQAGAVVALDVKSGEVLCLYSAPSFDENAFVRGMSPGEWKALVNHPRHPLKDRAISGLYPPGSTYKIITATAGLCEGVISPSTLIHCSGMITLGRHEYKCWAYKKGGHGDVRLLKALAESCDVYFYRVGQRLGIQRLARYARAFGLGRRTGIALPHEARGLVPTPQWKKRRFGEPWQEGETLSVAIGQGFNLVTPIQMARVAAAVATRGKLLTPVLVKALLPPDGSQPVPVPEPVPGQMPVPRWVLDWIHKGLVMAVNSPHGTGTRARLAGITVAGKTGTAQVVALKHEKAMGGKVPWRYRDHAWFICYAPAEDPEIAVAVVVEHGGHGGSAAAPVAAQILRAYFGLEQEQASG